jgi:hypothetical protein
VLGHPRAINPGGTTSRFWLLAGGHWRADGRVRQRELAVSAYYRRVSGEPFVPADFVVPDGLSADRFRLEPLGPQHNEADYAAWTTSIDHIRATPGFPDGSWPREMTRQENLRDLERHAQDFTGRRGFTYTVLEAGTSGVIGCVYIYPAQGSPGQRRAAVSSWVRADRAELDYAVYDAVLTWLERDWPFDALEYAART